MQIPRSYIEAYSAALNTVSDKGKEALVGALSQIDYSQDVASIRNQVISVMQRACGASATVAARLAADFYDGLRKRFGIDDGFEATVDSMYEPKATEGAVRAFVQDLVDEKPVDGFIDKCASRLDAETRKAANRCVAQNAKRDPKKPRWARVPAGAETCSFCIMLASRGFAYHSEETASHAHAHCDCRVIPSWDKKGAAAEGYDPDYYLDCYKHPEDHPEIREAANARRRELRAERKMEALNEVTEQGISRKRSARTEAAVDMKYVKSAEYAAKFDALTGHQKADKELLKCARAMLAHRQGTLKEDLYLVSVIDGETKASSTSAQEDLQTERTDKIIKACKEQPPGTLVGIHNHPDNIPPTGSDITAAGIRRYHMGITVLHDGTVYSYRVNEVISSILLDMTIDSYIRKGYSSVEAGEKALDDLAERGILEWEKM